MSTKKNSIPKKVVSTKSVCKSLHNEKKTSSATKLNKNVIKPKRTTKSDIQFDKTRKGASARPVFSSKEIDRDYVPPKITNNNKNSGDCVKMKLNIQIQEENSPKTNTNTITESSTKNTVENLYQNQNFMESSDSININASTKKNPLDTIKELPENRSENHHSTSLDSDEETLENIKMFRRENYFECHSAKSRTTYTESVLMRDAKHECSYSFFLNERLFPVPIKSDYNRNIRCDECYLPFDANSSKGDRLNGTIQAKVSLGKGEPNDVIVLLPVKDNLIIKEKRREKNKNEDTVYYGIVKLNNSRCKFTNNCHSDSLALRYEKGYKEHANAVDCKYTATTKNDIIIV